MRGRHLLVTALVAAGTGFLAPASAVAAPQCGTNSPNVEQGTTSTLVIQCWGTTGDVTYAIADAPQHGTTGPIQEPGIGAEASYTADATYEGPDTVVWEVTDETGSVQHPQSITVFKRQVPTCNPIEADTRPGVALTVLLRCTAVGSGGISYAIDDQPDHGTVTLRATEDNTAEARYTPDAGYTGTDTFTFRATNSVGSSDPTTVTITMTDEVNTPPDCGPERTVRARPGVAATILIGCADADEDDVEVEVAPGTPTQGTATLTPGDGSKWTLTYTGAPTATGTDTVQLVLSDGRETVAGPTITVELVPPTETTAPFCSQPWITVEAGATVEQAISCYDPENDQIRIEVAAQPQHGTASTRFDTATGMNVLTYTADAGFSGEETVELVATDDFGGARPYTQTITVTAPPLAVPTCAPEADLHVRKNHSRTIDLHCTSDSEQLSIQVTRQPAHGTLTRPTPGGPLVYRPRSGYTGGDSFTFVATNEAGSSAEYTQTLVVAKKQK